MWFLHGDTWFRYAQGTLPDVIFVTLSIREYMYIRRVTRKNKTPAHWPRLTENWWSDPQSELLDWQNPETGPKLSADPRSTVFFKSANPLDLSPKSTIRELFKAKSTDPRAYSTPSVPYLNSPRQCKHLGQVPITKQRSFQNLHQISILSSI